MTQCFVRRPITIRRQRPPRASPDYSLQPDHTRCPQPIEGGVTLGSLCTNGTHPDPMPKCRKSVTLRCFDSFRKRGNFLITRRSGVASDAARREAFAAAGCSRIPPPLPRNEASGVVRTSGALVLSDTWSFRSGRPNAEAPEVLTTPGASFLGSGGGIREQPSAAKASRRVASLATPDLRVMRKFQRFRKLMKLHRVRDLRHLGIGAGWGYLCRSDPRVTPPPIALRSQNAPRSSSPQRLDSRLAGEALSSRLFLGNRAVKP